jgi:hypothetical protein
MSFDRVSLQWSAPKRAGYETLEARPRISKYRHHPGVVERGPGAEQQKRA